MEENKQTVVEWLQNQLIAMKLNISYEDNERIARYIQEAKKKEKEQLQQKWEEGYHEGMYDALNK